MKENIILFDGECNLCDNTIRYIIKNDKLKVFKFSSLQSDFAKNGAKNRFLKIEISIDFFKKARKNRFFATRFLQVFTIFKCNFRCKIDKRDH